MLVLTRRVGEQVVMDNGVVVTVLAVCGGRIRLGIKAPPAVSIWREELPPAKETLNAPPRRGTGASR